MSVRVSAVLFPLVVAAFTTLPACAHELEAAKVNSLYVAALDDDDPARAWALMSPEAQAATDRKAFEQRWQGYREERHALAATSPRDGTPPPPQWLEGVTIHDHNRRVSWTKIDGEFVASGGLGELHDRRSPLATLAAFARALRVMDMTALSDLVGPELSRTSSALLATRASSIEFVLEDPSRLTLVDEDHARAVIEPGVTIRLEHFADGWRVVSVAD